MSTISLTDVDMRVRDHVVRQLDWDPEVDASGIGVTAKNGVVTLQATSTPTRESSPLNGPRSACGVSEGSPTISRCG